MSNKSMVILAGDSGSGKSYHTLQLIELSISKNENWLLLTNDKRNINYLTTLDFMSRALQEAAGLPINEHVLTLGENQEPDIIEFDQVFRDFAIKVIDLARDNKVVLYIDDIPLSTYLQILNFLTYNGTLKESNIKVVLTCNSCDLADPEFREIYIKENAQVSSLGFKW